MNKTTLKPRWSDWETECVYLAFKEKIQYKVMSVALEKTVSAINKKIKNLGLRNPLAKPGRIKGQKCKFTISEKTPHDVKVMTNLMKKFAPIDCYQKAKLAFHYKRWDLPAAIDERKIEKGPCLYNLKSTDTHFTQVAPHEYLLVQPDKTGLTRVEKIVGSPFYVPYRHIERWALLEGYRPVEERLSNAGYSFWKDGRYFTRAQVLMHINGIRIEKRLKPILLDEEEDTHLKCTQQYPSHSLQEGTRQVI